MAKLGELGNQQNIACCASPQICCLTAFASSKFNLRLEDYGTHHDCQNEILHIKSHSKGCCKKNYTTIVQINLDATRGLIFVLY